MTAVIRPVSIQYPDLGHRRISLLFVLKVILDMKKILKSHSQVQRSIKLFQLLLFHVFKAVKNLYILRLFKFRHQSLRFRRVCLSGIHWVDAVVLNRFQLFIGNISFDHISGCGTDDRLLVLFQELDTLNCRVCSLIKLSRQIFHGKNPGSFCCFKGFLI